MTDTENNRALEAIVDVRNAFTAVFNEALKTHGPAVTYAAAVSFAAAAVHQAEHLTTDVQNARVLVLGRWTSGFHEYLGRLNQDCDEQTALGRMTPEGMA